MIEFEENNELWLLNFLRLKAYYTYCRPGLDLFLGLVYTMQEIGPRYANTMRIQLLYFSACIIDF